MIELSYWYFFFSKFYNFILIKNNLNSKLLILLFEQNFFLNKKITFKSINKYLNFKINFKINTINEKTFNDDKIIKKFYYSKKNSKIEYKFFNLFFIFNYSLFNSDFKPHYNSKFFYISNFSDKIIILDCTKFLIRWKEAYDLIFNIFFYNFNPIIFSSNFFKKEVLALNWNYNTFEINLWKYYFPFFIFKLNNYNKKTDFFFNKLNSLGINFFLITDCLYHFKNLHYIKKKNLYSIGLINLELNPWLVDYPILNFFESFLTQLFFFKLLIFIERRVIFFKHNLFKNLWYVFLFKKQIVSSSK